jgi:hypothetical protein
MTLPPIPPQQRRRITVTPRGAPVGAEVTVNLTALPPMIGIQVGFGNLQAHQIVALSSSDGEGQASIKVKVPEFSEINRVHFFFVAFDDASPRGVSPGFHVTAADGTARFTGRIEAGEGCTALRTAFDDLYALIGDTRAFAPGTRVSVRGTIAEGAPCGGEGIPVAIDEIRAAL